MLNKPHYRKPTIMLNKPGKGNVFTKAEPKITDDYKSLSQKEDLDFPDDMTLGAGGFVERPAEEIPMPRSASAISNRADSPSSILPEVQEILTLIDMDEVPPSQVRRLQLAMSKYDELSFDEEFDLREDLAMQMRMVRAMRQEIMDVDGKMKKTATIGEVKQTLDTSRQLAQMLSKLNKELVSVERMRAIEACFLAVVSTFTKDAQKSFSVQLERKMLANKQLQEMRAD